MFYKMFLLVSYKNYNLIARMLLSFSLVSLYLWMRNTIIERSKGEINSYQLIKTIFFWEPICRRDIGIHIFCVFFLNLTKSANSLSEYFSLLLCCFVYERVQYKTTTNGFCIRMSWKIPEKFKDKRLYSVCGDIRLTYTTVNHRVWSYKGCLIISQTILKFNVLVYNKSNYYIKVKFGIFSFDYYQGSITKLLHALYWNF